MLKIVKGDITKIRADAIVNAANKELIPGGGVDGAINAAAGTILGNVMRGIGGTPTGTCVHTKAFALPAKYVIHAVGPIYNQYPPTSAAQLLRNAYRSAFERAIILDCQSVTAPLLSTGVYRFPIDKACEIAVEQGMIHRASDCVEDLEITLVAFSDELFQSCMKHYKDYIG